MIETGKSGDQDTQMLQRALQFKRHKLIETGKRLKSYMGKYPDLEERFKQAQYDELFNVVDPIFPVGSKAAKSLGKPVDEAASRFLHSLRTLETEQVIPDKVIENTKEDKEFERNFAEISGSLPEDDFQIDKKGSDLRDDGFNHTEDYSEYMDVESLKQGRRIQRKFREFRRELRNFREKREKLAKEWKAELLKERKGIKKRKY